MPPNENIEVRLNIVRGDQNKYLRVWFFASSKYCRHRKCYSFDQELRCVTSLISWLSFWQLRLFKRTLWHVQSRNRLSRRVAGMAKIDPVSPFYPILWLKKAILQRENLQDVRKTSHWAVNIYKLEVFTQYRQFVPPAYHENSWTSMVC